MVNKVILIGNLGRDPEVRSTPSGQTVANFSVATNRRWRDRDGQRQEQTEWHNIVCWGRQAEVAGQYLTRGRQIYVEGRLQTRSWDDRQSGEKRYRTEIVCDNFQMLGQRGDAVPAGGASPDPGSWDQQSSAPNPAPNSAPNPAADPGYPEPEDDDIPF